MSAMCVKPIIFSDVISMPSSARMRAEYVAVRLVEAISTKDEAGVISIVDSWVRSVIYTPPPIPVRLWLFQKVQLDSGRTNWIPVESGGFQLD